MLHPNKQIKLKPTDKLLNKNLQYTKLYKGPFITPKEVNNLSNQTGVY